MEKGDKQKNLPLILASPRLAKSSFDFLEVNCAMEIFTYPAIDTSHIKRKWLDLPYTDLSEAQKLSIYTLKYGDGSISHYRFDSC